LTEYISEQMLGGFPVVVRRRVKWGECDPAGVVYTPVFSEYVVSAFHLFLESLLGSPLLEELRELDFDTPIRALSLDFKQSLYPAQLFEMTVYVVDVRNTTFELGILFADESGNEIVVAKVTSICVHFAERRSCAVPGRLRELLEGYRSRCPLPLADALVAG